MSDPETRAHLASPRRNLAADSPELLHRPSLEDVHSSIAAPDAGAGFWPQWRAFVGPAILVSVGYMDPGNWGTDSQGGAQYRYGLVWLVALSCPMVSFMQGISGAFGFIAGMVPTQC